MTHYHSNALYRLNGRLQTLNNTDNKLYDGKVQAKMNMWIRETKKKLIPGRLN